MAGNKKIAIIGAGWYGCHTASVLSEQDGAEITVFEENDDILNKTSGNFGVRLHLGPHYPRSEETRKSCIRGYDEFSKIYGDKLVTKHGKSLYAVGDLDIEDNASKVTATQFNALAAEHKSFAVKDPSEFKQYQHVQTILDTGEKNIAVGSKLRDAFQGTDNVKGYLQKENITIKRKTKIEKIVTRADGKILVTTKDGATEEFDEVINATSYQQFVPEKPLLFGMKVVYQSCIGLLYEDMQEEEKGPADGLIIMDGWFPCMVHYDKEGEKGRSRFLLTHAKLTNLNSCDTAEKARSLLSQELATPEFLLEVEQSARKHMTRFYPDFATRFRLVKCKDTVHAKISSDTDFREAVVFQDKDSKIIHIIPGKIANVDDAAQDILKLVYPELSNSQIVSKEGYQYVEGGTLSRSEKEVSAQPTDLSRSTYSLQTGDEILENICSFSLQTEAPISENRRSFPGFFSRSTNPLQTKEPILSSRGSPGFFPGGVAKGTYNAEYGQGESLRQHF